MAAVMLLGTLNRVMIVELNIGAMLVAAMIAMPVLVAPLRALVGHQIRQLQIRHWLEAYSLPLVGHDVAVRRIGDHADGAVGFVG